MFLEFSIHCKTNRNSLKIIFLVTTVTKLDNVIVVEWSDAYKGIYVQYIKPSVYKTLFLKY